MDLFVIKQIASRLVEMIADLRLVFNSFWWSAQYIDPCHLFPEGMYSTTLVGYHRWGLS